MGGVRRRPGRVAADALPRFVRRKLHVPAQAWHLILQWPSGLSTPQKVVVIVRLLPDLADRRQVLYTRRAEFGGTDAVHEFMRLVDGEEWWLGDVALVLPGDRDTVLMMPTADGAFFDVYSWGPGGEDEYRTTYARAVSASSAGRHDDAADVDEQ
jgi:hypothetical protein